MMNNNLIAKLKAAMKGSRELDIEIARFVGFRPSGWGKDADWHHNDDIPHYTESLDAKLPWENITQVHRINERWAAYHCEGEDENISIGYGNTEILARRLAALKAREEA